MESLKRQARLDIAHVQYKGNAPCIQDLLAGQIDAAFGDVSSNMPHVRAGKLKALVVSGPTRLPMLPNVPTMNEAGFPFGTYLWCGVFVPAGTPQEIIQRLNAEINAALQHPAIVERFCALNLDDLPITTPEQFPRTVRDDMASWSALIRQLNLTLEQEGRDGVCIPPAGAPGRDRHRCRRRHRACPPVRDPRGARRNACEGRIGPARVPRLRREEARRARPRGRARRAGDRVWSDIA
jgi:hypothetical protein